MWQNLMNRTSRPFRLFLHFLFVAAMPISLEAQCAFGGNQSIPTTDCPGAGSPSGPSENVLQRRYFVINTAIGATTGGISARVRGGSFWHGFLGGALGGGLVYVGKKTVTTHHEFAGLIGREIGAAGSSIVQNASLNKPMLDRIVVPLGPTRLYIKTGDSSGVRLKIDLAATVATIYAATRPGSRLDISATFRAGAPVFMLPAPTKDPIWQGFHAAGVIQVRDYLSLPRESITGTIEHELVHVVQYDFGFIAWTEAPEAALIRRLPGGTRIGRYFDLSLNEPVLLLLNGMIPNDKRPWEREAMNLSR